MNMKIKRIVFALLLVFNLVFFPKVSLASNLFSDSWKHYFFNYSEKKCGEYSLPTLSLFSYGPPKGWEGYDDFVDVMNYCKGESITISPVITGITVYGWFVLLAIISLLIALARIFFYVVRGHFLEKNTFLKVLIDKLFLLHHLSLLVLFFMACLVVYFYISSVINNIAGIGFGVFI